MDYRPGIERERGLCNAVTANDSAEANFAGHKYTIVLGVTAALCINPFLYSNVGFDAIKDFAPGTVAVYPQWQITVTGRDLERAPGYCAEYSNRC